MVNSGGLAIILDDRINETKDSCFQNPDTGSYSAFESKSKIELFLLLNKKSQHTNAFIYDSPYSISQEKIRKLDKRPTKISEIIVSKEFNNISIEKLNDAFLQTARPLMPFFSYDYALHKPRILRHTFDAESGIYLKKIIESLVFDRYQI